MSERGMGGVTEEPVPLWAAEWRRWAKYAGSLCAAIVGFSALSMTLRSGLHLPNSAGPSKDWIAIAAAAVGTGAMVDAVRNGPELSRFARGSVWAACGGLLVSSGALLFDVVLIVVRVLRLNVPEGLPPMDWPGVITRVLGLGGAGLLAVAGKRIAAARHETTGSCDHGSVREGKYRNVFGYFAFALSLPYPVLKTLWAMGSMIGLTRADFSHGFDAEWAPAIPALIGSVLSLALVQRWGTRFPRWVPGLRGKNVPRRLVLAGGWLGSGILLSVGPAAVFKSRGLLAKPGVAEASGVRVWVLMTLYCSWLLWGIALAAATWIYQQRTRPLLTVIHRLQP